MNARMLVEFVDGSKTAIEMVAIANATGLVPDVPWHARTDGHPGSARRRSSARRRTAECSPARASSTILSARASRLACSASIETKHPRVLERMVDLKMGNGPYFTLYRPYHLTSLEVPLSAARAVLYKRADMQPLDHPVAEAVAVAKRGLNVGDSLGMIGETDYRGFAMTWQDARNQGALPLGLAENAKIVKPLKPGEILTYDNCVPGR